MNLNYKKFFAGLLVSIFLLVMIVPLITSASFLSENYTPIIQCGTGNTNADVMSNGQVGGGCDFVDVIDSINRVINWFISIATVIFTISLIWGGFLYVTSGMNSGNKEKAKGILLNTLTGFVIILVSWLIVYTILSALVSDQNSLIFKFIK